MKSYYSAPELIEILKKEGCRTEEVALSSPKRSLIKFRWKNTVILLENNGDLQFIASYKPSAKGFSLSKINELGAVLKYGRYTLSHSGNLVINYTLRGGNGFTLQQISQAIKDFRFIIDVIEHTTDILEND